MHDEFARPNWQETKFRSYFILQNCNFPANVL